MKAYSQQLNGLEAELASRGAADRELVRGVVVRVLRSIALKESDFLRMQKLISQIATHSLFKDDKDDMSTLQLDLQNLSQASLTRLTKLPYDIIRLIAFNLIPADVNRLMASAKVFRRLKNDNEFWKAKFKIHFADDYKEFENDSAQ